MQNVNSKLKIIVTGTRGFPNVQGGVETHCQHLYPYIVKAGCDVSVITRRAYVDSALNEFEGVKLIAVDNPKKQSIEAVVHTFLAVIKAKRIGCDILHVHAVGPALLIPFAKMLGMKVVMTNHGPDYDRQKWGKLAKFMLRLGESLGSRFSNKVISISKPTTENLKQKFNCESENIPNGVVIHEIAKTEDALKKFGLQKNKYILVVGRYVPEKGFHDLIKAYSLKLKASDMKLVIVGGADHETAYSANLREMAGKNENVVLTGIQKGKALQELYSHARLFILPSYHEGLPIVLLEAMSYGLNCIVSDIPANRVVELDNERYFKPGDIKGMAAKIEKFIQKPMDATERQVEMVKEKYDWEKIAQRTLEVYEAVVGTN